MSWRSGSQLFIEMWPLILRNIQDRDERIEFTGRLVNLFEEWDMDPFDIEDVHPDIRAAMRLAGVELAEPELYEDDDQNLLI